jgi:hypothetical protein
VPNEWTAGRGDVQFLAKRSGIDAPYHRESEFPDYREHADRYDFGDDFSDNTRRSGRQDAIRGPDGQYSDA